MKKTLKYHALIKEKTGELNCPHSECVEGTQKAYRWVLLPIEHPDNFLPNFEYDKRIKNTSRKNNNLEKDCLCCSQSMFITPGDAKRVYGFVSLAGKEKLRYTSLAEGTISPDMGIFDKPNNNGHFSYFEYENVDFINIFSVIPDLSL